MLEITRKTIAINRGEKTTVDTDPQKVLEHENLISDSEYITLDHETDVNKTHIKTESLKQELQQLHQTKQDTLVAGSGITIQGNTISATGGAPVEGAGVSFHEFGTRGTGLYAVEYTITSGTNSMTQFTFECPPGTREFVIDGALRELLGVVLVSYEIMSSNPFTISSGGITITVSDDIKLVNSNYAAEGVVQQETFTFYKNYSGGTEV